MFISSLCSKSLIWVPVFFPSLLVPCIFFFISLCIAFTFSSILQPCSNISVSILITSILNCASDRLAISSFLSSVFGALIYPFIWAVFFLSRCACYVVRVGALGIIQGRATHILVVVLHGGWGRRGNNGPCSALSWLSTSLLPTNKLSPSGADSQMGGFVYILGPCGSLQQSYHLEWKGR